jgi:hypothetical protein
METNFINDFNKIKYYIYYLKAFGAIMELEEEMKTTVLYINQECAYCLYFSV